LYLSIRRTIEQIVLIIGAYHFYQLRTKFIQLPAVNLTTHAAEFIGDHQCGFRHNRSTNDHIFSIQSNTWKKIGIQ